MVRKVQMSWDSEIPMPAELNHSEWDCDDSEYVQPRKEAVYDQTRRRRKSRVRSQSQSD